MNKFLPYIYAALGFIATVIVLVVLMDSVILPDLIHDKKIVTVPAVIGKNITSAEKILIHEGLTLGKVSEQFNENVKDGIVINQIPSAGIQVKEGRPINLSVSKGKEMVSVPYVIGQNLRSARLTLKNAGLEVGELTYQFNDSYGQDTVSGQQISSGRNVPFNTRVNLTVSKGSENQVMVPLILGKTLDEAKSILEESGLVIGTITYKQQETYLPNTVVEQHPAPNELAKKGDIINVVISK